MSPDDLEYITSIESRVEAVETKTRPKKLRVRSSNGMIYGLDSWIRE